MPEPLERRNERRAQERRTSSRREIALDVREPGKRVRSCLGDLSESGVSFVTTSPPVGDEVELRFTVPTWAGTIEARGAVVSRRGLERGTRLGINFTAIDAEAKLAIADWFRPS